MVVLLIMIISGDHKYIYSEENQATCCHYKNSGQSRRRHTLVYVTKQVRKGSRGTWCRRKGSRE